MVRALLSNDYASVLWALHVLVLGLIAVIGHGSVVTLATLLLTLATLAYAATHWRVALVPQWGWLPLGGLALLLGWIVLNTSLFHTEILSTNLLQLIAATVLSCSALLLGLTAPKDSLTTRPVEIGLYALWILLMLNIISSYYLGWGEVHDLDDATRRAYGNLSDSFACIVGFYAIYFSCGRRWGHGAISLAALLMMGGKLALAQALVAGALAFIIIYSHNRALFLRRATSGFLWLIVIGTVAIAAWRALPLPDKVTERATIAALSPTPSAADFGDDKNFTIPPPPKVLGLKDCLVELYKLDCTYNFTNLPERSRVNILATQALSSFYMRAMTSGAAIAMLHDHPWTGVGYNQSSHFYREYVERDVLRLKENVGMHDAQFASRAEIDTPLFLLGAELGWPGLALGVLLILALAFVGLLAGFKGTTSPLLVTAASWAATMPLMNQTAVWLGPANVLLLWQMLLTGFLVTWLRK